MLDLDQGAKLRLVVLQVEAAIRNVSLNKGVDPADTDVLDPEVVVRTPSYLDVVPVDGTSLRVIEVDHVQVFLPGGRRDLPLRVHIAILQEGLQDHVVVQRLADFVKLDGLALVERIRDTVRVLALANLTVERLPRISDNLFVTGHPHDVPSRQPSLEAKEMDY